MEHEIDMDKRIGKWLAVVEQMDSQIAWCKAHPGNEELEQSLAVGQRHAMAMLALLQQVAQA